MQLAKTHPSSATHSVGQSRMTLANVVRGRQDRPIRAILYGVEGVGKSTFASQAPAPIFLCSEDGTAQLDVARFPTPRNWADVLESVRVLTHEDHSFKTLVIDTMDWLEPLCWQAVCQAAGKANIEEFGYGKGYVLALDQWRTLLGRIDMLVRTRKMNVVLVGHASIRRVDDPQTGPFDRYRMKLHDKAADVVREWVDAILFARHEVMTVERKGKIRGVSSGARVMHTQWTAAYDAKNRFDLPDTLPLAWDEFELAVRAHVPASAGKLRAELDELIPRLPDPQKAEKALREWAGDNPARLAQLLDKARSKVALHEAQRAADQAEAEQAESDSIDPPA
jgi:DNA-directed RNA polymerase specialized sigma24 family protein